MKNLSWIFLVLSVVFLSVFVVKIQKRITDQKVGPLPDGSILVPSNQLLRPAGSQVFIPGRPLDLVLSKDENYLYVKNSTNILSINIRDQKVVQTLTLQSGASFKGLSLSHDHKQLFTTNSTNKIWIAGIDNNSLSWKNAITLPGPQIGGQPAPGGLAINERDDILYVTLSRNNSIAVVRLADTSIVEIPVGIAPYDVLLFSSSKAYVTNWGGRKPGPGESTSVSSGSKVLVDPVTGIANNGSVSVVSLDNNTEEKNIEVGLHPGAMILSADRKKLYVACANSDIISVINTETDEVSNNISVHLDKEVPFGSGPNALALSPDGKFLYVANGTENAICIINTSEQERIVGYIPTGWFPGAVITNKSGNRIFVANIKGVGSRAFLNLNERQYSRFLNERQKGTKQKGFNTRGTLGSVSIIPAPGKKQIKQFTETVHLNNSYFQMLKKLRPEKIKTTKVPVPVLPGQESYFKHVVYIIKENRTYDQVFGDMPQGDGDTTFLQFGERVTPNHHLLASTFVLMDNFNCSGVLSADGHQWTDEAYVTDYIERSFGGFTRSYPYDGDDALAYASTGFIWDNVLRHGLTFRDYGEFVNAEITPRNATFTDIYNDYMNGTNKVKIRAIANLEQLTPYLCPTYVGFPGTVPDVYRAAEFIKELKEYEKNNNFPNFIIMLLPNDHTSGTRPGMPKPESAVADNDLALGQIIDAISHSKFWRETCIFVTEDDPQAGLDHVDGHRTVGFVISPFTKRGEVISTYYSQINMVRTMENILGIPPMNQFDLTAEPMTDCFRDIPDFTPFKALKNNIPLDDLNPPLESLKGDALYWAKKSMEQDLDDIDRIQEDVFNRILWHAVKGYDRPYPELSYDDPIKH